ncbi:endo-beta-N-acetylglucosaminidase H-like [Folsomia candida]|uniref:Endo-beta-N-acetylglucosaminidase H n=1 Tax=Folsomia candida TaxID=158441 RepID=A0A226ENB3_FOLCA|nr:endo-beta-N-acetylglucosaminidase H-like [Folsomia candida]OXA58688.1 Endo-beta-N-acetylglucosaminidase H [Folsomia candida]
MPVIIRKEGRKEGPLGVMYVEVNGANFLNTGCYTTTVGENLFDIGIIFAANINYDVPAQRAVLHLNQNVTTVLQNANVYVKPLQDKGIKVLLSILGNHQGAGVCNFPDETAARDFATQLNQAVRLFDLDGIDFDDEYADYGNNGTGQPNAFSFIYLLRELRTLMPDKIISFYYYGPATSRLSYQGLIAGDYLDYSWNSIYGTYSVPNVPGLTQRAQLGPAAVNVRATSGGTAQNLATQTVNDGYGIYLYYDLPNTDINTYLSGISERLHGVGSTLTGGCLRPWPPTGKTEKVCACAGKEKPADEK